MGEQNQTDIPDNWDIISWIEETDGMERGEDPDGPTDVIGGGWNYRLVRRQTELGEEVAIHEVYYDEDGSPRACTEKPVSVSGEDAEVLAKDVDLMKRAFSKDVLSYESF